MKTLITICAIWIWGEPIHATPTEMQIPGGESPKINRELVLIPKLDTPDEPHAISVTIRDAKSHDIIASDTFVPFGVITEVTPSMRVVWSPTGEYVALNLRSTRHTTNTFIYRINGSALTRMEIPSYWTEAQKILGARADFRGGVETPLRWLDDHTITIRSHGTLRDKDTGFDLEVVIASKASKLAIQSVAINKMPN